MSGIYSIVSDSAAGMFRLRQSARPWDDDGKASTLAEKAEEGALAFSLDPKIARGAHAAKTALEEAKRIGGPKAAAEERLAKAEQRLKEVRQEARLAAARGDREKLAELAREAAQLARQAGRAAKEYASGVAAAAEMGVGGDPVGAQGGVAAQSSIRIESSTTTVQLRQVEISLSLTVSGGDSMGESVPAETPSSPPPPPTAATNPVNVAPLARFDGLPERVREGLAATGLPIGGFNGPDGRRLLHAMISDNDLKASRYKEADAFARRVESALGVAKSVIGEAKAANGNEPDARRRADRRKMLDDLEKDLSDARESADDLRGAAFGSAAGLGADIGAAIGAGAQAFAPTPVAMAAPVVNISA